MHVVRRGNHDGVDVPAAVQQDAIVLECFRLGISLKGAGRVPAVHIAQGDDVLPQFGQLPQHPAALTADADTGDIQPLAGRLLVGARQHAARDNLKSSHRGSGGSEKTTAMEHEIVS